MNDFRFRSHADHKANEPTNDATSKNFDPNEESLSEGSEYVDDTLRMVEQPLSEED